MTADTIEEAVKNAEEQAAKAAEDTTGKAIKAAGDAFVLKMVDVDGDIEMRAIGDTVPAASDHPAAPEAPPIGGFLRLSSPRRRADVPGTSGAGEFTMEGVDDELIIPPTMTTEEERDADDDATDYYFLQSTEAGFKEMQQCFSRRWEKLQRRAKYVKTAEQELL